MSLVNGLAKIRRNHTGIQIDGPQLRVAFFDLPAVGEGFGHRIGGFRNFLEEIVGKVLSVDVAGGQIGFFDVPGFELDGRAVVVHGLNALETAGRILVQNEDLSLGRSVVALHAFLAVHLEVLLGLFDKPVNFRGGHVMVMGQAHEDGLAAAFLSQEELARRQGRVHGNGMGALEVIDRQAEGFARGVPLGQVAADLQRDHLGIG